MTAYAMPGSLREHSGDREGRGSFLGRCLNAATREIRAYLGMRAMMALDDRMLSDIGLTRAEIEFAAHFGRLPKS